MHGDGIIGELAAARWRPTGCRRRLRAAAALWTRDGSQRRGSVAGEAGCGTDVMRVVRPGLIAPVESVLAGIFDLHLTPLQPFEQILLSEATLDAGRRSGHRQLRER